jgi:NAD(P)-dependent dehydrogenase (short-subunit alcohol dehydrogenase family)
MPSPEVLAAFIQSGIRGQWRATPRGRRAVRKHAIAPALLAANRSWHTTFFLVDAPRTLVDPLRENDGMDKEKLNRLHDLTGRVAIVTGGTRGIGLAIAEGLSAAGAKLAVASRKADACADIESRLRARGHDAIGIPTHMGDIEAISALVDRTVHEYGRLDIVVNNAANALSLPFGQLTVEAWDKSLGTNLRGPVFLVERALPHLEASGNAAILNVVSAGAFLFSPTTAMYASAKAGLMAMTRSMASVFAPKGIRVNALAPGTVDTDMVRNNPPEVVESMSNACFMRRAAHPDEMVGAALLMCSDAGSYLTGQVIIVDGGLTPH